jgi:putative ABC transport system permease protein
MEQAEKMVAWEWAISPGYFRTMGIRLVEGRDFTERDTRSAPAVAIISESLARTYWPHEPHVIGKRIIPDYPPRACEVIGVVANVRSWPRDTLPGQQIYLPRVQSLQPSYRDNDFNFRLDLYFVVRTRSNPVAIAVAARNAIREVDPGQPVNETLTMDDAISKQFGPWRSTMLLLGLFAGLAVLLSAIGIYGVISYTATQRTHEIGIRMAMGAGRGDVLRLVMKSGLLLALAGIAIGSGAAYWLTRLIANQLYDVTPTDPVTFASVALVLLAVALLACYLPARRAASLDPMAALRSE